MERILKGLRNIYGRHPIVFIMKYTTLIQSKTRRGYFDEIVPYMPEDDLNTGRNMKDALKDTILSK
jgi:hypothetical protein